MQLGAGSDGETIALDSDDGSLPRLGIGILRNNPNGEKSTRSTWPRTGYTNVRSLDSTTRNSPRDVFQWRLLGETSANATVRRAALFRITTSGAVTLLGNMDHVSKGWCRRAECARARRADPDDTLF